MKSWFGRAAGQDGPEREQLAGRAFVGGPPGATPGSSRSWGEHGHRQSARDGRGRQARRGGAGNREHDEGTGTVANRAGNGKHERIRGHNGGRRGELRTSRASSAAGNRRAGGGNGAGGRCVGARGGQHIDMVSSMQERRCCAVGKSDGARDETAAAPGSKQGRPE